MSIPATMTMKDVSGSYTVDKNLSDKMDDFLSIQGVPWAARKALNLVSINMTIHHDSAANPPTLAITMAGVGPMKANTARTVLDNVPATREHPMMGHLNAWGQTIDAEEIGDAFCAEGWAERTVIETHEENAKLGWQNVSYFGIQEINGQRYYCRKTKIWNGKGESAQARFVNGYKGPVA